ncbi:NRDE family protein [Flavobacterium gawalongense]|uniref:NRDE family protein n=1 Tax=Flavobacterium gawalongense TaxID=2594432 RepID=A0A553BYR0_9FLAO|nr:NRDE family protein [Flavobacterium gawalongense]TRX01128.1 NRDE family protein [Flavobacterium gawalongense]TRX05635.1 NRDE family protein [Flavobacterium gawalongense]TRX13296.1 NRDE family protein [Flavobacterium gawalongense]TRX15772.1 NRDE family protein [Flavobacterium gawalongense]TRX31610.1 NRDE family protein [Flavobacterium gawalongense]
MCTVSFVNVNDTIIITSNRDEKVIRPSAIPPKDYTINGKNLIFPKDSKAGGTWFVVDANGAVLVLLNGADEKHKVELPYRKSRGLIVLDIISRVSPKDFWNEIDLENIEPFTLVLFQNMELFQLRWNGNQKEATSLDIHKNHIWSSSTLYPVAIREKRSDWFYTFLDANPEISEAEMLHFHRYAEEKNQVNGLVINRNDEMKTLSITQSVIEKNKVAILHCDLITQKDYRTSFITI